MFVYSLELIHVKLQLINLSKGSFTKCCQDLQQRHYTATTYDEPQCDRNDIVTNQLVAAVMLHQACGAWPQLVNPPVP